MNILWIPHSPWAPGAHRRDQYFIDRLQDRHRIYTVGWQTRNENDPWSVLRPKAYLDGLRFFKLQIDDQPAFHVRRIPDFLRPLRRYKARSIPLNQYVFRRDIKTIVRREAIDLVVTGPSSHLTGFPPFDLDVPLVFDYLDCHDWDAEPDWQELEQTYLDRADAVLCVSSLALERAQQAGRPCLLLPNGADIDRMRAASGEAVRRKHGLEGTRVVSLIGLTCSPRLYFLEAVLRARARVPSLKCLLVGQSARIEAALRRMPQEASEAFIFTGPVPYEDIASYFAASDVGLYPVDETVYYNGASPIKMIEYTAAGKPVVVPYIKEAQRLGFSNFIFARPEVDTYAEGILKALAMESITEPQVEAYDWNRLADTLETFLQNVKRET